MAGSKRKRLQLDLNSSPQGSTGFSGEGTFDPMNPIPQSQTPPAPPAPADTIATSTDVVGDQPIPALSAVSVLEVNNDPPQPSTPGPQRRPKYKVPPRFFRLFGKLLPIHPQSETPPPPPADTTAKSVGLVADQLIPAASAVNGSQDTDNPPQPPAPGPNPPVRRRRDGIKFGEKKRLWKSNLRIPGGYIQGGSRKGIKISLGYYLTEQEAKDVQDRVALKLFETTGVVCRSGLNLHDSRHTEFMEEYKDWNFRDFVWQFHRHSERFITGKSSMRGVVVNEKAKTNSFTAKTAYKHAQEEKMVHYHLGMFESEEEAGWAYDLAVLFLHRNDTEEQKLTLMTNFRPSGYSESEILSAGDKLSRTRSDPPRVP